MSNNKTEKATPKRREEARKKGQVAKSADLNGAVVMLAGLIVLGSTGAALAQRMGDGMRNTLLQIAEPDVVSNGSLGTLLSGAMTNAALAVAPIAGACALAAIVISVLQTGIKPTPGAIKPDFKRMNPISGAKNIFGPNALFETLKNLSKVGVVGAIVFAALFPRLPELAALVGIEPIELGIQLSDSVHAIGMRAGFAYLAIGLVDVVYQRHRHEKGLRMEKKEVIDEGKGQALPAEVRSAIRRRQMAASRARMMQAVPDADVVVTNPTHFSVALKYDGTSPAPKVIAKGQDLIALKIREIAAEHGVPVMPDPPLARSLYASVEVDQQIPEELYQAVAQVLAFVYRIAGRRKAAMA